VGWQRELLHVRSALWSP